MITPTVGRIVWYRPSDKDLQYDLMCQIDADQPFTAQVVYVHSDTLVGLLVTDHRGYQHRRDSVHLHQGDPNASVPSAYCEWMPYQHAQAAKVS